MNLSARVAKLEALASHAGQTFSASPRHQSPEVVQTLCAAAGTGYWDRLTAHPVVAPIYATPTPTAEQWATVAAIARQLMATEAPDPNDSGLSALAKF